MKKIISLLLMLSLFVIVWLQSAMAHFVVIDSFEIPMQHGEMEMMWEDCCETMQEDCEEENHDCCYTPFKNSSNISNINIQSTTKNKFKWKIINYSFLAILNEWAQINFIEKLTSSPNVSWVEIIENTYTTLIGITKSNC